ncbi:TIGR01777 family oxidoreductase [Paenibacillus glufosinatiresistens]|uniref:TIGR01777 family oxidoreductase n=1 Tax=Paenibacillus glufosinatiresistens TaxID=3070657 RepID=UPI00286DA0E4|nr:TIGR01777 family oxidoreductase [Paenibacillus sp. YX.27]
MKAAICGGTGYIGSALAKFWIQAGHEVLIIGRSLPGKDSIVPGAVYLTWNELQADPSPAEGCRVLVNLAGATLSQRWSPDNKRLIMESRLKTVAAAGSLLDSLHRLPEAVIQASAVAIYGTSESAVFTEASPSRVSDFPSEVVKEWEDAADRSYRGVRLVKLRTGIVLGSKGGAFPKMKLPFLLGFGGRIGTGRQWMSWIHEDDMIALIDYCSLNPVLSGPVNAVAPIPVTNAEFGRTVARVYQRPYWFPLPASLLKTALGELSQILLRGQRVLPAKLQEAGFNFGYPELDSALRHLKSRA